MDDFDDPRFVETPPINVRDWFVQLGAQIGVVFLAGVEAGACCFAWLRLTGMSVKAASESSLTSASFILIVIGVTFYYAAQVADQKLPR